MTETRLISHHRTIALLFLLAVNLSDAATVAAQQDAESGNALPGQQEILEDLTAAELNQSIDQLSAAGRVVTDLTMRFDGTQMRFDATIDVNAEKRPWIVQLNLTDQQYRAATRKYKAAFDPVIHQTVSAGRTKYHSVVWLQKTETGSELKIPEGPLPESGELGKNLQPLNALMRSVLAENHLPGATLAVAFEQTLLFERGFGYSQLDPPVTMQPNATMRIASISKPITAVAVLLLAQDGVLDLDEFALTCLSRHPSGNFDANAAAMADPRWKQITVRQLLQHTAGMDRDVSKDTVFQLPEISRALSLKKLAKSNDMVRYQLRQSLDFDPGTKHRYSNIGYCILGRIIEAVSGKDYADFVQQRILTPCGMTQTRLARTRLTHRAEDEVRYYVQKPKKTPAVWVGFESRNPNRVDLVDEPYGMWDIEVMDSHGGWTSTAPDLLRFVMALEHPTSPLLNSSLRSEMLKPPEFGPDASDGSWYGCGWSVRNLNDGTATYWHTGLLAGTSAILVHRRDGYLWAVLFNCDRSQDDQLCSTLIDSRMHWAVNEVRDHHAEGDESK
ncbi:MAG: serine hydrolase domain-containing protein [Planctomycetota bacterium]